MMPTMLLLRCGWHVAAPDLRFRCYALCYELRTIRHCYIAYDVNNAVNVARQITMLRTLAVSHDGADIF